MSQLRVKWEPGMPDGPSEGVVQAYVAGSDGRYDRCFAVVLAGDKLIQVSITKLTVLLPEEKS